MNSENSTPSTSTPAPAAPRIHPERQRQVRSALTYFSIMAWITGVMLLALCARMIAHYVLHLDVSAFTWIAIAHGWVYMIFLITTANLGLRARWAPGKWILTALGGVVPFLSFFVEHARRKEVTTRFQLN
ncbi:DUF3817 domain-containing protein [Corynebacterium caspium]|uniref:DUF3817 domain-containing protein n=1 Tax=Corynebacterium caspium TaxID=234828 RepID=UPI0003651BFD|nr:DUF3817 domain-containing protein [Corynebacterium caspium]WKD58798.1 hypothetical protein CCASP_01910 [Corynebacterium caspium DSM 44850]